MKIKLFIILALALFMISCKSFIEDVTEDMISDPTSDTVAIVKDDTEGDMVTIEIPVTGDDPAGETDTTESSDASGDDVVSNDDSKDDPVVSDDDNNDSLPVPDVIVVKIPKNELLTHVNIGDAKALALSPRNDPMNSSASLFGRMMSIVGGNDCQGLLDFGTQEEIATEGSVPCFSNVEMHGEFTFANYYLYNETESPALMFLSETPIDFSIIIDASGDVHHLPGQPKKRNSFKNIKMIHSHNGKPTYINKDNKLVWFDLSTDIEVVMVEEAITNFSIKPYSDGDHYIVDSAAGVKRIKPDGSDDLLTEIPPGNWHDIGDSIQYVSSRKFKRKKFDIDGNAIPCGSSGENCISYPESFWYWINNGMNPDGSRGMPTGINFSGSIGGCENEIVNGQRVMICNGKAFRVKGDDEDMEVIDWNYVGHMTLNLDSPKMCTSENYVFFYSETNVIDPYIDGNGVYYGPSRLTRNDLSENTFDYILTTHKIIDLECISDSELAVIGTIGELTETLSITEADTMSPVVTVVDSQITDVITP